MNFKGNFLNLNDCDLGYEFEENLNTTTLPQDQVISLKTKCFNFIKILLEHLIQRMPSHLSVFREVKLFNPQKKINATHRPKFSELPLKFANSDQLRTMEIQYHNLLNIKWEEVFQHNVPEESIYFWKKVVNPKNAAGDYMFRELALFAFKMLSVPSSNTVVKRSFSVMNIIKSKLRNKMLLELLNAIMTIKLHF
jgi:hypothetical protein